MSERAERVWVPLSPVAIEIIERMRETYPAMTKVALGAVAIEVGLRHLSNPSGAPSAVHFPIGDET